MLVHMYNNYANWLIVITLALVLSQSSTVGSYTNKKQPNMLLHVVIQSDISI